jgi:hypothetical protein
LRLIDTTEHRFIERSSGSLSGWSRFEVPLYDGKVRRIRCAIEESKKELGWGGCGTMLHGKTELVAISAKIKEAVDRGIEVAGAAKSMSALCGGCPIFSRVVDDDQGEVKLALKRAQISEQGGNVSAVVFAQAM